MAEYILVKFEGIGIKTPHAPVQERYSAVKRFHRLFFAFGIYSNYKMLWNKIMGLWVPTAVGFYCGKVLCKIILQ